jgi:hypothetical protein
VSLDPRVLSGLGPAAASGSTELLARLGEVRVGLAIGSGSCAEAIGSIVADQLVRTFRRLVAGDRKAEAALRAAIAWAGTDAEVGAPDAEGGSVDVAIVIGDATRMIAGQAIFVGSNRWRAHLSRSTPQPTGSLGLGAPAVAFAAVLETFKVVFAEWIEGPVEPADELHWSLFDWSASGDDDGPEFSELVLPEIVWAGTGAVAHGGFAAIVILPSVSGRIIAIDPDPHGQTSARRYPFARSLWTGEGKVEHLRDWLEATHPGLGIVAERTDLNSWYAAQRPSCDVAILITTPDSKETRRHAAMKLPRVAINGWAERFRMGVETFPFRPGRCLACAYPMDQDAVSEIDVFRQETGLSAWRVRELLDAGQLLSDQDIAIVAQRYAVDVQELQGRSLRSVREHLCAVGRLVSPSNREAVDVPLGFVAGLAGVAVVAELIRSLLNRSTGKRWEWDARMLPADLNAWPNGPRADCFVCADPDFVVIQHQKYGLPA